MVFKKKIGLKSGFTLIEVIIVIGVIGIMSAIAIPNIISWLPDYRLRSAARDIVSCLQEAKLRAVKEDATTGIEFDFTNNTLSAWVDDGGSVPGDLIFNAPPDTDEVYYSQINMPLGIDMYQNGSSDINNPFGFNSRGFPATNIGSIFIRNNKSNYRRILVNIPGNIRIEKSTDGSTWN